MLTIPPERVQELRRARGMSRTKLAKLSKLTDRQIVRLEGALPWKGELTTDVVLRIAAALQVQPESLLGDQPLTEFDFAAPPKASSCSCCN
ncbi:helix-turn-helix domain-containing protein [Roseovarius aestuarii]|nr:helix-turn-helix domain-containing protein [Roseovarius aestuarii]